MSDLLVLDSEHFWPVNEHSTEDYDLKSLF